MGVKWTKEQQQVISLRDRNILVSAAAGSGKTAVLVERILSKIMDKNNPVDIDRLLIMTFTRAAAGEMKERISAAIEKALYENPDNEHLQRQTSLIHTAQITTIDGFCAYVIRNYFHLIGLDPGYRTADEGELKLIKADVLKELLETYYAEQTEEYRKFVECYASGKTDEGLSEYILKLYDAAMSHPYPEEWLRGTLNTYRIESEEELEEADWMKLLWESVEEDLREAVSLAEEGKKICLEAEGPYQYEPALDSDLLLLRELLAKAEEKDYDAVAQALKGAAFARLSTKKCPDVDEGKKAQVKAVREEEKEILKDMGARYFQCTKQEILESLKCSREPLEMLVELTLSFMERFAQCKREKNILDFTDMEHFALTILMEKDSGEIKMTQAARELSGRYDEVLVDEYQDSNLVQEYLTTCVSGWVNNRKNIFMVGDVKQSIYRFRLARPELFMEKYKTYSIEDSLEQRIDLHKNFRSRHQVLESANYIFHQIMGEDLGGIHYDEAAALYPGAAFPEGGDESFPDTELLLVEKDGAEFEDERSSQNAQELEALAVGQKIRSMVGVTQVVDKATGQYRPLEYGDIVILLRTAYGWADTFREVLASLGIPAYTASRTGYFSATEIVTVLNYLKICDNPLQDIPLAGVLRSPVVGCSSQELAVLKNAGPEGLLYESVCNYSGEDELGEKLKAFISLLEKVRDMAVYTPVHRLILFVLRETGYGNYARALPGGEQRAANLSMLVEKAMDYEKTSYRGLFNFVRYIEQLQKYEVDFGEVNLAGAGASTVQIMTIHKSKGLEFPVVFTAGMGKQFNFQDMNARLLVHPDLGIGADAIFPEKRLIASSLNKQMIRRQLQKESLGEELRVLYVALTRAKEKLIMTGTVGKLDKLIPSLGRFMDQEEALLPVGSRMKAKTYWDFVLPALARHRCMEEIFLKYGVFMKRKEGFYDDISRFVVQIITAKQMTEEAILQQTGSQMEEEMLKNWDCDRVYDETARKEIEKRFNFIYPFEYLKEIPVKVSVSELKKRSWHDDYEKEENLIAEVETEPCIPAFIAEKKEEYTGAARGTAYHRVMECLDYARTETDQEIEEQITTLLEQQKISEMEKECIRVKDIRHFLESGLGRRMKTAALAGKLYREQPFVISRQAKEIDAAWPKEETVLVQGIIDAYFLEGDDIILVDYKTDRVRSAKKLAELYGVQLEDYAQALERMLGRKVREKSIYSFTMEKEILL